MSKVSLNRPSSRTYAQKSRLSNVATSKPDIHSGVSSASIPTLQGILVFPNSIDPSDISLRKIRLYIISNIKLNISSSSNIDVNLKLTLGPNSHVLLKGELTFDDILELIYIECSVEDQSTFESLTNKHISSILGGNASWGNALIIDSAGNPSFTVDIIRSDNYDILVQNKGDDNIISQLSGVSSDAPMTLLSTLPNPLNASTSLLNNTLLSSSLGASSSTPSSPSLGSPKLTSSGTKSSPFSSPLLPGRKVISRELATRSDVDQVSELLSRITALDSVSKELKKQESVEEKAKRKAEKLEKDIALKAEKLEKDIALKAEKLEKDIALKAEKAALKGKGKIFGIFSKKDTSDSSDTASAEVVTF